jgi:hypothetical protein
MINRIRHQESQVYRSFTIVLTVFDGGGNRPESEFHIISNKGQTVNNEMFYYINNGSTLLKKAKEWINLNYDFLAEEDRMAKLSKIARWYHE